MDKKDQVYSAHLGRKIERIRLLREMTQADLGELLGVSKQAISKMEQTEKIDDSRLNDVASALGVTLKGLKKYNEETVLYYSNNDNFHENSNSTVTNIDTLSNLENFNQFPIEQVIELFEELLAIEREKYEALKKKGEEHECF